MTDGESMVFILSLLFGLATIFVVSALFVNNKLKRKELAESLSAKEVEIQKLNKALEETSKELRDKLEESVGHQKRNEKYNKLKVELDTVIARASDGNKELHVKIRKLDAMSSESLIKILEYDKLVQEFNADNKYLKSEVNKLLTEQQKLTDELDKSQVEAEKYKAEVAELSKKPVKTNAGNKPAEKKK